MLSTHRDSKLKARLERPLGATEKQLLALNLALDLAQAVGEVSQHAPHGHIVKLRAAALELLADIERQ